MLERTENSMCNIYKCERKNPQLEDDKQVKWVIHKRIKRYPSGLAGSTSYNFLFSPSFRYYIDIDYEGDTFLVRDIKKSDKVYSIPNGLISLSLKGSTKSKKALPCLAKLMTFENEDTLRVINKGGVDCFYKFKAEPHE